MNGNKRHGISRMIAKDLLIIEEICCKYGKKSGLARMICFNEHSKGLEIKVRLNKDGKNVAEMTFTQQVNECFRHDPHGYLKNIRPH